MEELQGRPSHSDGRSKGCVRPSSSAAPQLRTGGYITDFFRVRFYVAGGWFYFGRPGATDTCMMSELQAFAKNVWIVNCPNVHDFGIMWTTRMTIVKLSDRSFWVNSPVSVPSDTLKRITAWGPVRCLVAATPRHVWRPEEWHALFPQAQLWVPRATPLTLKKGYLPFTGRSERTCDNITVRNNIDGGAVKVGLLRGHSYNSGGPTW